MKGMPAAYALVAEALAVQQDKNHLTPRFLHVLLVLYSCFLATMQVPKVQHQLVLSMPHPLEQRGSTCAVPLSCCFYEVEV